MSLISQNFYPAGASAAISLLALKTPSWSFKARFAPRLPLLILGCVLSFCTAVQAATPLTNCTGAGGVLSNGNSTCTFAVTVTGDSINTANDNNYVPLSGSLRAAIMDANAWGNYANTVGGDSIIDLSAISGQTITLGSALPLIFSNVTIAAPAAGVTINGSGFRCLFVTGLPIANTEPTANPNDGMPQAIAVSFSNLTLSSCGAKGGTGYAGGLGAGAGLFVNQQVTATLNNISFASSRVQGGDSVAAYSGGGGMGGWGIGFGGGGIAGTSASGSYGGGGIGGDATGGAGGGFGGGTQPAVLGLGLVSSRQGFLGGANGAGNGGGGGSSNAFGGVSSTLGSGSGQGGGGLFGGGVSPIGKRGGIGGGSGSAFNSIGGAGGFGGGGGGEASGGFGGGSGPYGNGGFGGGSGDAATVGFGVGGFGAGGFVGGGFGGGGSGGPGGRAGAALGAGIFAVNGAVVTIGGVGSSAGGAFGTIGRLKVGKGAFLQGAGSLTFNQAASETFTVSDDIADQTGSWPSMGFTADGTYATGGPFNGTDWSYTKAGSWNIVKSGTGTLVLGGANTFSGAASAVNAGTLRVSNAQGLGFGSWTNSAAVEIATPLTVTLGSTATGMPLANYTQVAAGTLNMGISSTCVADKLIVKSTAALDGTLNIAIAAGCTPTVGTINLITAASVSGSFSTVNITGLGAGFLGRVVMTATTVDLVVSALAAPAITTAAPANGTFNTPYTYTVVASGNPAPTYALASGSLPAGLMLDATSGAITGTPTAVGMYTGSISASNGVGTAATQSFNITIAKIAQPTLTATAAQTSVSFNGTTTLGSTGGAGAGGVTYSSSNSAFCGIVGNILTANAGAGSCNITATKATTAEYFQAVSTNTLTITLAPAAQTITFSPILNRFLTDGGLTVSATGGASGNPVAFSSLTPTVCSANGGNGTSISIATTGTCTLRANQAAGGGYGAAMGVDRSFSIVNKPPKVTISIAPGSEMNGTITPIGTLDVSLNSTMNLTVTANARYLANLTGTCGGRITTPTALVPQGAGTNSYLTDTLGGDCTVIATFVAVNPVLTLSGSNTATLPNTTPLPSFSEIGKPATFSANLYGAAGVLNILNTSPTPVFIGFQADGVAISGCERSLLSQVFTADLAYFQARCTVSTLSLGSKVITANFSGDNYNFPASINGTTALTHTVVAVGALPPVSITPIVVPPVVSPVVPPTSPPAAPSTGLPTIPVNLPPITLTLKPMLAPQAIGQNVSPASIANGTVSPYSSVSSASGMLEVLGNSPFDLTITANPRYLARVTGTCGGTVITTVALVPQGAGSNIYRTAPVGQDCTVIITFTPAIPTITVTGTSRVTPVNTTPITTTSAANKPATFTATLRQAIGLVGLGGTSPSTVYIAFQADGITIPGCEKQMIIVASTDEESRYQASCVTSALALGSNKITVSFSGDKYNFPVVTDSNVTPTPVLTHVVVPAQ